MEKTAVNEHMLHKLKLAPPHNAMFPPLRIWPFSKRMWCKRRPCMNFWREYRGEPKKGGWTWWLLGPGPGPGPGQPWQWLMRSDWAVLPCSGGSEPYSARETFQPLSPLSGAIHSTEYSPQGLGGGGGRGGGKKAQGGTGRGGGKGLEEQGSTNTLWPGQPASTGLRTDNKPVNGYMASLLVRV